MAIYLKYTQAQPCGDFTAELELLILERKQ